MKTKIQLLLIVILAATDSFASLGETKGKDLSGIKIQQHKSHAIYESTDQSGLRIREFLTPSNQVFAVAWEGQHLPDFKEILGAHFSPFQGASTSQRRRHGPINIKVGNLVVFSGKYQREFIGHAYLEDLRPSEISVDSLK